MLEGDPSLAEVTALVGLRNWFPIFVEPSPSSPLLPSQRLKFNVAMEKQGKLQAAGYPKCLSLVTGMERYNITNAKDIVLKYRTKDYLKVLKYMEEMYNR